MYVLAYDKYKLYQCKNEHKITYQTSFDDSDSGTLRCNLHARRSSWTRSGDAQSFPILRTIYPRTKKPYKHGYGLC